MNPLTQIKNTQKATLSEVRQGLSESASWHAKFKDSAYIFAGGLSFDLTEGDILAVVVDQAAARQVERAAEFEDVARVAVRLLGPKLEHLAPERALRLELLRLRRRLRLCAALSLVGLRKSSMKVHFR